MKNLHLLEIGLTLLVVMLLGKLEAANYNTEDIVGGYLEDELETPSDLMSEFNVNQVACKKSKNCDSNKGICQNIGTCKGYVVKGCHGGCSCCIPPPVCKPNCINGKCTGPNKCLCAKGWTGDYCQIPTNATVQLPVGEECCNMSTTYYCSGKGGSCMPKNDTCIGDEYSGSLYCLISHLKSCKCCIPIDCSAETLDPCKALNGTCIGADETCDASTHSSVTGPGFCGRNDTCKCCYPNHPAPECLSSGCSFTGNTTGLRDASHDLTRQDRIRTWSDEQCETDCAYVIGGTTRPINIGPFYGDKHFKWCYYNAGRDWGHCGCPNSAFLRKHVCRKADGKQCKDKDDALAFSIAQRPDADERYNTVFFGNDIRYEINENGDCKMTNGPFEAFRCTRKSGKWHTCFSSKEKCIGFSAYYNGHLYRDNCKFPN